MGDQDKLPSTAIDIQAIQPQPTYHAWQVWQQFLKMIAAKNENLKQPLRRWLHNSNRLKKKWNSYYDLQERVYYTLESSNKWKVWQFKNFWRSYHTKEWYPTPEAIPRKLQIHIRPPRGPTSSSHCLTSKCDDFLDYLDQQFELD